MHRGCPPRVQQGVFFSKVQRSQGQAVQPGAGSSREHEPSTQTSPTAHTVLQSPRRRGSLPVSGHEPSSHACTTRSHAAAHWPCEQSFPAGHVVPQAPQFFGSSPVHTQSAPHRVSPVWHWH